MEQFSTNKISLQPLQQNPIFTTIKSHIINLSNNAPKYTLKKAKSSSLFSSRPYLRNNEKIQSIKSQLDQIGKEASIFNNDKLITNIKLETLDDITVNEILEETMLIDKNNKTNKKYNSPKKNNTRSLTPFNKCKSTGKRMKKNNFIKKSENNINDMVNIKNLTLDLNCNKLPQASNVSNKTINYNKSKKKIIKANPKNLNQFINKPKDKDNKRNNNYNCKFSFLMTPMNNKNKRSKKNYSNSSFSKLNDSCEKTDDSMCLTSVSRIMNKSYLKGKSMDTKRNITSIHFPNKSLIKSNNKDKLVLEVKKIFSDKIALTDDLYQSMNDIDKKNCINFLLEALKEMFNVNKVNQSKNDEYKEMNKTKEKKILDDKNEIKELKKEITKLNKIIKANVSNNLKLNQKVENLKILLEKEKNKNKKNNTNKRSVNNEHKIINGRINYKNKINGKFTSDNKNKLRNKSMDTINSNNIKIDENNYRCNQETQINEDKGNDLNKKEEIIDKNLQNNLKKNLFLDKNIEKENKGLGNNSDCTNFSDANNGIVE